MPAPTVLIGLGGLGCSIAQAVYARVPEAYRDLVGIHILDTDVSELSDSRYRSLGDECMTQTSDDITVGTCLDRLEAQTRVFDWFPARQVGSRSMLDKKMPLGASQVRVVSRLALLDTIFGNRLDAFNHTLGEAIRARGERLKASVRVVVINSIAGGTGSGAFLQVALYVSEYFKRNLGVESPVIRGVVIMPEVFVQAGDYKGQDLIRNVRANGYAAIKELDGLVRVRSGQLDPRSNPALAPIFPLELEYRPGQKDSTTVEPGPAPFDYVFLYSELNSRPALLGSKDDYIRQAVDALYLQLFSPLEGKGGVYSQEDNLVRTLIRSGDRARYASSGIAKLVYPRADIVRFCALKWAVVGVSEDWLEIDDLIDDELQQNDRDRKVGVFRAKPERYVRFVEILRQKGTADRATPFHSYAFREAHVLDKDGRPSTPKSKGWQAQIAARIEEVFGLAQKESIPDGALNIEQLRDRETVVNQVERFERWLNSYRERLVKITQPLGNMIAREALWDDYLRRTSTPTDNELRLGHWLAGKGGAIHPVSVRYFLGEVRIEVERLLLDLESKLDRLNRELVGYQKRDWDASNEDENDPPGKYAAKLAAMPWWVHRIQRPLLAFSEEYQAEAESQRDRITRWARAKLEHAVYGSIRNSVRDMLADWESFFAQLDAILLRCRNDIGMLAGKHDNNTDPMRVFVCASASHKLALWESECREMRAREMPEGVCRQIYRSLYERRAQQHFDEAPRRIVGWEQALFMEHVVGWCCLEMEALSGLDLNIKEAIDRELAIDQEKGGRRDEDSDEAFRRYVSRLDNLAYPCVPIERQNFQFWCLHDEVASQLGTQLLQETIGRATPEDQIGAAPGTILGGTRNDATAYSRQELILMRMTYGLKATDLPSMVDPSGIYRLAYEEMIARSRSSPPQDYTPHLDWRWDSPAFLPELDDEVQRRALRNLRRATLHALILDPPFVSKGTYDGRARWERYGAAGEVIHLTGPRGLAVPASIQGLFHGLAVHYWMVGAILFRSDSIEKDGRRQPAQLPIITSAARLLDEVLGLPNEASTRDEGEKLASQLIHTLIEEVRDVFERSYGRPNQAREEARGVLKRALDSSAVLADPAKHGLEAGWKQRIEQMAAPMLAPAVD